jgi:hypothetical protein
MQRARPARPSQAQSPARAGTPHRRLWSTSGTGRSTSRAHADSARALLASAFGPTERQPGASIHSPRVCWPRSSSAALCRSPPQAPGHGTEPLPGQPPASDGTARPCAGHCFARAQQCPANPPVLVGQRSWKVSAPRVSVRALEHCHRRTRLASPRAGGPACTLASLPSRAPRQCAGPRTIVASW